MILSEFLPAKQNILWDLSSQMGIKYAICKCAANLTGLNPPWHIDALQTIKKRFNDAGFIFYGIEGDPFEMDRIKLGLPGYEEDIEHYKQMLCNMGELEIPLLCYNFMAGIGWHRSKNDEKIRGGALTTRFRAEDMPVEYTKYGKISAAEMWHNYEVFIKNVIPVAESNGVRMGLHPDDPPLPELRGIARIMSSMQGMEKAMSISNSSSHGVTFCQANFKLMGVDIKSAIHKFAEDNRLFFFHFRDVEGTADNFIETFHDNGPTDMPEVIKALKDVAFDGPVRVDHVPTMAGEENLQPGYGVLGRLFAVGYLKGIADALRINIK